MAIVYQSVGTGAWTSATSVVVTKPTGLAVGELMLAIIGNQDATTANFNTPSGWTSHANTSGAGAGNDPRLGVFYKTADSADVAASNFTFTQTGTAPIAGAILRITNWGFIDQSAKTDFTTSGNLTPITGITPTRANSLLVMMVVSENSTGNDPTYSGYAITTSNPTWTEIVELLDGTNVGTLAVAVATRPEITATGDATIVVGGTPGASTDHIVRLLNVAPQVDGSFTASATKVNAYALTPMQSAKINAVAEAPSFNSMNIPAWTNPDKPSTTWTNPDK